MTRSTAAVLLALLALLPGLAAALRTPGPQMTGTLEVATEDQDCSESELYEKVGDDCFDMAGQISASKCCRLYDACRQDVTALGLACAARLQQYVEGCDLLPTDTSTQGSEHGELRVVDTVRLCSEGCQTQPALLLNSTLERLADLEARCSPHLDRIRMAIQAVQDFDEAWLSCPVQEHVEVKKPRWGPVEITTHWVPPVLDLKKAFEATWTALPATYSDEFRIRGTVGAIQEEMLSRPDLPISCPESHVGRPVHLVVGKIQGSAMQVYQRAIMGGFANMAGIGSFIVAAPSIFEVGGEGLSLASSLAANPTSYTLDKLVDYMMDNVHRGDKRYLKKLWRWMSGTRTDAFLTLADPERKGHVGGKVKFQCSEMSVNGKLKNVATWVDGGDFHTVVTAKHLAFLITTLA